jgi:hypothetical protein
MSRPEFTAVGWQEAARNAQTGQTPGEETEHEQK